MTIPAGYLVYVQGPRGPEPQRWSERPASPGSGHWSKKSGRVLRVVEIGADDFALPFDELARKFPAPGEVERGERTALAGVSNVEL